MRFTLSLLTVFTTFGAYAANFTLSPVGNDFKFDKTVLNAKPGEKIKLTLKNTADMQHNFVLTQIGKADAVAAASLTAGAAKNWLAESPDIIAHTKLVDPKQSDTIEFTAPKTAGDYPYVCTFPGHAATMKGVLKVK